MQGSERKIAQAQKVAISYLRAVGVEASSPSLGVLNVPTRDGRTVTVALVSAIDKAPANASVAVLAEEVASPELERAIPAFHAITRATGHGEPIPVDRGPKIHVYGDDLFLIIARHTEFRRAPNLSNEHMARYMPIIKREVRSFVAKNVRLLAMMGYDAGDCETLAKMWVTVYAHTSELPSQIDNERLVVRHLRDQFYHTACKLAAARGKQVPDADLASSVIRGHPTDYAKEESMDPRRQEDEMQAAANDITASEANRRRKAAEEMLKKNLSRLDHATMVSRLMECTLNASREYAVRLCARKLLRKHVEACDICQAARVQLPELSENAA